MLIFPKHKGNKQNISAIKLKNNQKFISHKRKKKTRRRTLNLTRRGSESGEICRVVTRALALAEKE